MRKIKNGWMRCLAVACVGMLSSGNASALAVDVLEMNTYAKSGFQSVSQFAANTLAVTNKNQASTVPQATHGKLKIGSWNIRWLGNGDDKDYATTGAIAAQYDILAVQEVMNKNGVNKLISAMEEASGHPWVSMMTGPIGRGSYKEHYTFIYDPGVVNYKGSGAVTYMDSQDIFAREGLSAPFVINETQQEFVMATIHIIFGDDRDDRVQEIRALSDYKDWLQEIYPEQDTIMIMGDFNFPPSWKEWDTLKGNGMKPLITRGASTVSTREGRYANLYDNIWINTDSPLTVESSAVNTIIKRTGMTHERFRDTVSDHVPVQAVIDLGTAKAE